MEIAKSRNNFIELGKYMVPIWGDIELDKISKEISNSRLERIAADVGLCAFKYLSSAGILWGLYHIANDLYAWKNGADILKGF